MRRARRLVLKLSLCLLGGACATAATVAYGWWRNAPYADVPSRGASVAGGVGAVPNGRQFDWRQAETRWYANNGLDAQPPPGMRQSPIPAPLVDVARAMMPEEEVFAESRYGYPARCARAAVYFGYQRDPRERIVAGWDVGWRRAGYFDKGMLPAPIWRGLLLDVAIYGFGLFALVQLGSAASAIRRRGRCRACGYSRAGLAPDAPCPECGAPTSLPEHCTPAQRP